MGGVSARDTPHRDKLVLALKRKGVLLSHSAGLSSFSLDHENWTLQNMLLGLTPRYFWGYYANVF